MLPRHLLPRRACAQPACTWQMDVSQPEVFTAFLRSCLTTGHLCHRLSPQKLLKMWECSKPRAFLSAGSLTS